MLERARVLLLRLWRDPASPSQEPGHERTEREAADVGEESDAAAVRRGAEQPEVRLDELVQEPQPEEDPGGDVDEEDREDVGQDPGAWVEDEIGAQHGGDSAAGTEFG